MHKTPAGVEFLALAYENKSLAFFCISHKFLMTIPVTLFAESPYRFPKHKKVPFVWDVPFFIG